MHHTLLYIAVPLAILIAAVLILRLIARREIDTHNRRHQQELEDLRNRLEQRIHQSDPDHPAYIPSTRIPHP